MRPLTPAELKAVAAYVKCYPELRELHARMNRDQHARKELAFNIAILDPPRQLDAIAIAKACLIDT